MAFKVDQFGKVTISLGGGCRLWCKHCYITASQFRHSPLRSVASVLTELSQVEEPFSVACISGDTDCFIHETAGMDLIRQVLASFPSVHLMFTSRLVPSVDVVERLIALGRETLDAGRFFVPCVSFVSWSYPNQIENPRYVPSSANRLKLLERFAKEGIPTFLALRPTFPFSIVPRSELSELISRTAHATTVVLGEAFILDSGGEIASRLGLAATTHGGGLEPLTFLPQEALWEKRVYPEESSFTRELCRSTKRPFFMRSMSAMRYLQRYWDFQAGASFWTPLDPLDISCEAYLP